MLTLTSRKLQKTSAIYWTSFGLPPEPRDSTAMGSTTSAESAKEVDTSSGVHILEFHGTTVIAGIVITILIIGAVTYCCFKRRGRRSAPPGLHPDWSRFPMMQNIPPSQPVGTAASITWHMGREEIHQLAACLLQPPVLQAHPIQAPPTTYDASSQRAQATRTSPRTTLATTIRTAMSRNGDHTQGDAISQAIQ